MLSPTPSSPSTSFADLPPKVVERVAVLGHQLACFAEALKTFRRRAEKGRLANAELAAFPAFILPETFTMAISVPEEAPERWTVVADEALAWTSPRACALLHLPGLKRSWQGLLRSTLLADLWQRLPQCWVVDHTVLPPHAAIAGLGLARWADFVRLRDRGERFQITLEDRTWQLDATCVKAEWEQAAVDLAACAPGTAVVERLGESPAQHWQVAFGVFDGRWERVER